MPTRAGAERFFPFDRLRRGRRPSPQTHGRAGSGRARRYWAVRRRTGETGRPGSVPPRSGRDASPGHGPR